MLFRIILCSEINPTTSKMVFANQEVINTLKENQFATMINSIPENNLPLVNLNASVHEIPCQSLGEQHGY